MIASEVYEEISEENLTYSGTVGAGQAVFELLGSNKESVIKISDVDYSINRKGLNIVIIDNQNTTVIDSVCINFDKEPKILRESGAVQNR